MFNCAKKLLSLLLVLSLLLALPMTALAAEEDEKTISVSSAEDLLTLSESCKLDTWSEGVTVELEADVSLEGVAFSPIASFSGTFHGNGHTISGLSLSEGLSLAGLFQRVQKDALIEDLNVSGTVKASSTCEAAGGLAGGRRYDRKLLVLRQYRRKQHHGWSRGAEHGRRSDSKFLLQLRGHGYQDDRRRCG